MCIAALGADAGTFHRQHRRAEDYRLCEGRDRLIFCGGYTASRKVLSSRGDVLALKHDGAVKPPKSSQLYGQLYGHVGPHSLCARLPLRATPSSNAAAALYSAIHLAPEVLSPATFAKWQAPLRAGWQCSSCLPGSNRSTVSSLLNHCFSPSARVRLCDWFAPCP